MTELPTAVLGRTGLRVTRLGYGTSGQPQEDDHWRRLFNAVLDAGINFIDTANDYGVNWGGPAEENIGRHISGRRSEYYIATKCGCAPSGGHVWTRENAFRGLHESLKRLRTDYVDIMQYHNPTVDECEAGDLVTALQDMRQQGKVRWIGVSTGLPDLATFLEWDTFDVIQVPYSALERNNEDWITRAAQSGAGIIIRGGVGQGEPTDDNVSERRQYKWRKYQEAGLDELREEGESRTTFILRFTLTHPHSDTNIVGTTRADHLAENVEGMLRGPLRPDAYTEAKRRLDSVGESPETVGQ
jgi:aryl-alcohol dehydrogenase-like predicted oxidoreductase